VNYVHFKMHSATIKKMITVNFNEIHFSVLKNTHMKGKRRKQFLNY